MPNRPGSWLFLAAALGASVGSAQEVERQPLHLCAPPREPIENEQLLAGYDMTVRDEYYRYFDELNAYLICLQKSQTDIIQRAHDWNERFRERFGDG